MSKKDEMPKPKPKEADNTEDKIIPKPMEMEVDTNYKDEMPKPKPKEADNTEDEIIPMPMEIPKPKEADVTNKEMPKPKRIHVHPPENNDVFYFSFALPA